MFQKVEINKYESISAVTEENQKQQLQIDSLKEMIQQQQQQIDSQNEMIQQQQQQSNIQVEMIQQLQRQMLEMTTRPLLSQRNNNPIYSIPFIDYTEIEPNHNTDQYFKNLLIRICQDYRNTVYGTWIGAVSPNSRGWMILTIYDTNDINDEGFPRYCGGCYQTCTNHLYTFSTHGFTFNSKLWQI